MPLFGDWLATTRDTQSEVDTRGSLGASGDELADYVRYNALATIVELVEALQEIQWKPWKPSQGVIRDRRHLVEELVDALHFVGNLLVVLGVDDAELNLAYERKIAENRRRRANDEATRVR